MEVEQPMHIYEYTKLQLNENEFNNLVFMNAPSHWKDDAKNHKFLICICGSPLNEVVDKLTKESGIDLNSATAAKVFEKVFHIKETSKKGKRQSWFQRQLNMSKEFEKNKMNDLWIRNLRPSERKDNPNGSFYIQDGICRSLVYAMKIKHEGVTYCPVKAIHATSWDLATGFFFNHRPKTAKALEHNGVLKHQKNLIKTFTLPSNIQINMYERD